MKSSVLNHRIAAGLAFFFLFLGNIVVAQVQPQDTIRGAKTRFPLPQEDLLRDPYQPAMSGIHLPSKKISYDVEYDTVTGMYKVQRKVGNMAIGLPLYMSLEDYRKYDLNNSKRKYWQQKIARTDSATNQDSDLFKRFLNPTIGINGFDKIFGSNKISIKPNGAAELSFGVNISSQDNPSLEEALRTTTTFDFKEKIQMGVTGEIGTKLKVGINYNTEATFDFENQTKIAYTGDEDEIIQSIEAGNVSLPLNGTLITGGQNLFGIKTAMKFGRLKITSVLSQQKSETQVVELEGGAMQQKFEIQADEYDVDRHFFLSHFFRDKFDESMSKLPIISSGITVNRIEVWVTNKSGSYEDARNILAIMDLAEKKRADNADFPSPPFINYDVASIFPENTTNSLYKEISELSGIRDINNVSSILGAYESDNFKIGQDFEKIQNARRLSEKEFTVNAQLGYISLNTALNPDDVLAVAMEYTYQGRTYRVGEFSNDNIPAPQTLILKMLKGTSPTPRLPMWDLMMKNIYAIGAYQVKPDAFEMNVMFRNDKTGQAINYIPEGTKVENGGINGKVLLRVFGLDRLNRNNDPQPDGVFDFLEGKTIVSSNGKIIFPTVEPFGSSLAKQFDDPLLAEKYSFPELYDSTQNVARQIAEKNKYYLEGKYQSSNGSEIQLNALNIQKGSVTVTANGVKLEENADYTVDYTLGRVTILRQDLLQAGTPIRVSLENNALFAIQTKTLVGAHADYQINDDFVLGTTLMHLSERPLTNKVNIGDEPISNTIWGLDGRYRTEVPWLTRMIDKLPFLETKAKSSISVEGEFAHLIPGSASAIGDGGTAYIDDFEGTRISIDMRTPSAWVLASTPQGQPYVFPEAVNNPSSTDVEAMRAFGYNRARLAWYTISPDLLRDRAAKPDHVSADEQSDHLVREVYEQDIFPFKESPNGIPTTIPVFNLAFYPAEKGPYNYEVEPTANSAGTSADGKLVAPETRWGGIMRNIRTNDFETSNIEFIEFWMMDPFVNDTDPNLGKGDNAYLYINLGNVSEDILKDARKSWENGLPRDATVVNVDTTAWGRVSTQQFTVHAFDNNAASRQYQDVGFDGLRDDEEGSFFKDYLDKVAAYHGFNSDFYQAASQDPSNDNYHFYRGSDYDAQQKSILERYKLYNGPDGNSPTSAQSKESYPTSATLLPDIEDINQDNTLSETESYFQYKVRIHPSEFKIGKNNITDIREDTRERKNGETTTVKWYQFKVPIYEPDSKVGPIQDFKSVRFMRMFMRGFNQNSVLRFARFELVRGEWRKYRLDLSEATEGVQTDESSEATFDISAVNIEENGSRSPINYVLPPGINRVVDPTNPQMRQLNEQSIVLKVNQLEDGDARAAFRNVELDMRKYGKMKMEVHAEKFNSETPLEDNQLRVFVRMGSDYKQNYYEYEIPLKVSPEGTYDNNSDDDRRIVWPDANRFDFELDILPKLKLERDAEMLKGNTAVKNNTPYRKNIGENRISVVGTPSLSNVRTIMIGIRNPSRASNPVPDNGFPQSGEVWLNELRLTDFDQNGGWATNGRVVTKLADFATISLAGNVITPGYGSIEKKVSERSQENVKQYDLSANFQLGKFFPKHNGVKLPLFIGYSESFRDPEYNPLDPDVKMQDVLDSDSYPEEEKDRLLRLTRDYTRRKAINVTNAKIETFRSKKAVEKRKKEGKANKKHPLSISNFALSYNYSELYHYDINTDFDRLARHSGAVNYIWNNRPKNIRPFRKVKFLRSPWLRIIRDFNFYPLPSQVLFRSKIDRLYQETQTRNVANPNLILDPLYQKKFTWSREYGLRYNLSKGLKIDLKANNLATIDEPEGALNPNDEDYYFKRDSIIGNLRNLGRNTRYSHQINATYNVPINKIPLLNWVTANARYTANVNWNASSQTIEAISLGNMLKNYQTFQVNSSMNLQNFYNKIPYLKKVDRRFKNRKRGKAAKKKFKNVSWQKESLALRKKRTKIYKHRLGTKTVKVRVVDAKGRVVEGSVKVIDENKVSFKPDKKVADAKIIITGKRQEKTSVGMIVSDGIINLATMVKNISATYSENNGTLVPGYMQTPEYLGLTNIGSDVAPGWPFIFGWQDDQFASMATSNGWISTDTLQTQPFVMTHQTSFNLRATLEPLPGLRIDITANRSMSRDKNTLLYPLSADDLLYEQQNQLVTGTFQMTFGSLFTSFDKIDETNYSSKTFENFKNYRLEIAHRLAQGRQDADYDATAPNIDPTTGKAREDGYPSGYSPNSQDVLLPAFVAAYSGQSPSSVGLGKFPQIPFPNWRIKYDGLSKWKPLKKYFKKITLAHGYNSVYSLGNYRLDASYHDFFRGDDGFSYVRDELNGYFLPEYQLTGVTISEKFTPLFSIDLGFQFGLTTRFEYRTGRNISLSFANNQLVEMVNNEMIIGVGWRIQQLPINIKVGKKTNGFKSDLNIRADLGLRDNMTVIHKLSEDADQITAGQKNTSIKLSADYNLSERFNLRFFYDQVINNPRVSTSWRTSNTQVGFSLRFTLI